MKAFWSNAMCLVIQDGGGGTENKTKAATLLSLLSVHNYVVQQAVAAAAVVVVFACLFLHFKSGTQSSGASEPSTTTSSSSSGSGQHQQLQPSEEELAQLHTTTPLAAVPAPLLSCIRARRSVFPRSYVDRVVQPEMVRSLLEAAMWAPYHGPVPPWRFVVLGKEAMVEMQRRTLAFYDTHWRELGWADGQRGTEAQYRAWRQTTEEEITGRWGPVSFMIAVVMRRQAGSKRLAEWEEAAATTCAVQNMHLQASANNGLACYWSSWHDAFRDSDEMKEFLGAKPEDKCFGVFVVAACDPALKRRRFRRPETHLSVAWRA